MLPLDDPCDLVTGPGSVACNRPPTGGSTGGLVPVAPPTDGTTLDPLSALADSVAKAAHWTSTELGKVVAGGSSVDLTNSSFLAQYAVVFAASTVLVLTLWLLAVAKRAIRGVPMATAMSEAVGLLWLAVLASAFTPLVLYVVIAAVGSVTDVLSSALGNGTTNVFDSLGADLEAGKIGGGPIIRLLASLATIALCGALWVLLLLRDLGLYVGALLSVVVYSGLVSRDWWGKVRRWAGVMVALIMVEPVIVIIVGLASALQTSPDHNNIAVGLAVTVIAVLVAVQLIWKTPGIGDGVKASMAVGRTVRSAAGAVTGGGGSAAAGVQRGISTHADRGNTPRGGGSIGTQKAPNNVAGGIAAHSQRTPKKKD
ncbi:hypothetical protein ACTVZO_41565 [Streptomyces sp. IBSNAI002]|uniref:hypothetical protein n=1 Tax=unclassified Streptomyces TaxID=2593676 RepID=UPI0037B1926F